MVRPIPHPALELGQGQWGAHLQGRLHGPFPPVTEMRPAQKSVLQELPGPGVLDPPCE